MKQNKKFKRQCLICKQYKTKEELFRITKDYKTCEIKLNDNNSIMGCSVYLCKNSECIEKFFKNKKSLQSLNSQMCENIKNTLGTVLKN